jgi:hypothetical protein
MAGQALLHIAAGSSSATDWDSVTLQQQGTAPYPLPSTFQIESNDSQQAKAKGEVHPHIFCIIKHLTLLQR